MGTTQFADLGQEVEHKKVPPEDQPPLASSGCYDQSAVPPEDSRPLPEPQPQPLPQHESLREPQATKPSKTADSSGPQLSSRSNGMVIEPDLTKLSRDALQQVEDLVVCRPDIGSIMFHGLTDCRDLDIPPLVHLDIGEVLVYPMQGTKPPEGQGLNKRATVTMFQCWPPNGRGHLEDPRAHEKYRGKIQQMTEEKRATFIDYDCKTGVWKFQVEHF